MQESFVDAARFRPGHDEYTPLGSGWTAESEIGAVQRTLLVSRAGWSTPVYSATRLHRVDLLTKYATSPVKGIHCFKYIFFAIMILLQSPLLRHGYLLSRILTV